MKEISNLSKYLHKQQHTPEAIAERLLESSRVTYLKDFIYGAIDGAVTTFAVVSGVAGAKLSADIVVILGIANLLGDGFSMAASNYLGTKADIQLRSKAKKTEISHIDFYPEGEREEVRQIFAGKGFSDEILEKIVSVITSNKDRWVNTMLTEELGFSQNLASPLRAATTTLIAFCLIGSLPLLAFICEIAVPGLIENPFLISSFLTGIAFFCVGAVKSRFVSTNWFVSGLETFIVGGLAASIAYFAGHVLRAMTS